MIRSCTFFRKRCVAAAVADFITVDFRPNESYKQRIIHLTTSSLTHVLQNVAWNVAQYSKQVKIPLERHRQRWSKYN